MVETIRAKDRRIEHITSESTSMSSDAFGVSAYFQTQMYVLLAARLCQCCDVVVEKKQ